jgi:hypothetical protein
MDSKNFPQLPNNLKQVDKNKQVILTLGFSLSVHVLRSFYYELISKIKTHPKYKEFTERLDEILPVIEPGGFHIHLCGKDYSMMYKPCKDIEQYDLNKEVNKIPNLNKLSSSETEQFVKEIDICASSISSINGELTKKKKFKSLIKDIFDTFDTHYSSDEADKHKDINLKLEEHQRTYHMSEDKDALHFGIHIEPISV